MIAQAAQNLHTLFVLPQVSESQRRAFVDDVMGMLELDNVGHRLIGEDADSGLSMGERKRVTIGTTKATSASYY